MPRVDPRAADFRAVAAQLTSSVAIVIALVDGEPLAATASSVAVASLDPPLLTVSFRTGSRVHRALTCPDAGAFTASFLREEDHALARRFADPQRPSGWAGIAGLDLVRRDSSPPRLASATVWFECQVTHLVAVGDHDLFVAEVIDSGRDPAARPLLHHRGRFHGLGPPTAPAAWHPPEFHDLTADW